MIIQKGVIDYNWQLWLPHVCS